MNIVISMLNPSSGERQVSPNTNVQIEIAGQTVDGYGVDESTIYVQFNSVDAIRAGVFQLPSTLFTNEIIGENPLPEQTTRFFTILNNPFLIGDKVRLSVSGTALSLQVLETEIISIESKTIEVRNTIELLPIEDRPLDYRIEIESISRGYQGSISTTLGTTSITINPLALFSPNSIIFVSVGIQSTNPITSSLDIVRKVFVFRTTDLSPPQLIGFPQVIYDSNVSFKIIDMLGNIVTLNALNVEIDGQAAISQGIVSTDFMGSIVSTEQSNLSIYLRRKIKYQNNQQINFQITASDQYGNQETYQRIVKNKTLTPEIEFVEIVPNIESTLNPANAQLKIKLRTTQSFPKRYISLYMRGIGLTDPETGEDSIRIIEVGEFRNSFAGQISVGREATIDITKIEGLNFNNKVTFRLVLQEATESGDIPPDSNPLYVREFNYSTIPATIPPSIDSFFPSTVDIVSPSTQIRFGVLSVILGALINSNSITVVVSNSLVIDNGLFVNGWSGSILSRQGSGGHSVNVIINQPQSSQFESGQIVFVEINAADTAGNTVSGNYNFTIANTNLPILTTVPAGGVYKDLTRIAIESDQPAIIYFTLDGSNPVQGQVNTFSQQSPVRNIPIFKEGITQVKAFGVNQHQIRGPLLTEIYELNPFVPEIEILSPLTNALLEKNIVEVDYKITLQRGFLVLVELSINQGPFFDVQNTLLETKILAVGLRSGSNSIRIRATDNAGNIGLAEVLVSVTPSQIIDFSLNYAPLLCPQFTTRTSPERTVFSDFIDTRTVALIGLGRRREVLIDYAIGDGSDGQPLSFQLGNQPDGRHFALSSFPVKEGSLIVRLFRKNRELILPSTEFKFQRSTGQIVLDHPLELGESLTIDYISELDVNAPLIFRSNQLEEIFIRHGNPSVNNSLSLAAELAFENGAERIIVVQADSPLIDVGWSNALKSLESQECYWVTPVVSNQYLDQYSTILSFTNVHVNKMSEIKSRKERITSGFRIANTPNEFNNHRMILAHIDQNPIITKIIQGEVGHLNGSHIAACISGRGSSIAPISLPLSNRNLVGFQMQTSARSPRIELDKLINQGFLPIQALVTGASIYQSRTTSLSNDPTLEEVSIVRIGDYISKNIRRLLQRRFIGRSVTDLVIGEIRDTVEIFLGSQVDLLSKSSVNRLFVDGQEPRQVNLEIALTPLFPLNNLSITISFNTNL